MSAIAPSTNYIQHEFVVPNHAGIHARVSLLIAKKVKEFTSSVRMFKGKNSANCESVLELLSLGAAQGERVRFDISGDDAKEAFVALQQMFDAKFDEETELS